ncbi:FACT complex subunit SPT16, variant 2 [Perkinsus olseni]|uniref:FACT complex subunit n=2 Tax=Perkinsus olseni TaxID=32597 RepID=A0A7J6UFE0_PEROL|nr:FACT complex subunit SPT16, variant 2 [Perkinsus olseni]
MAHDCIANATATVSSWMVVKDAEEVENMKRSAVFSTLLMKQVMVRDVESVIENDTKKTHEAICDTVESAAENKDMLARWAKKFPYLGEDKAVDVIYTLIQSGKEFKLRPDVQPNQEALDFSCIVASVGAKYREYSTNITRTLIVDPTKHQRAYYNLCLSTMDTIIKSINGKESVTCQEVYNAAVEHIKSKASTVEFLHDALSQFQTDCGYSIGLEFRDGHMLLNAKNHKHITPGMCLNLSVGFAGDKMVNEKKKPYAVWVCDSAYISTGPDGKMKVELLTSGMSSGKDEVMYYLDTDQPGENEDVVKSERKESSKKDKKSKKEKKQHDKTPDRSKKEKRRREEAKSSSRRHKHKKDDLIIESRLRTRRNRATAEDEEERKRLMDQQYELRARKVEECRARLLRSGEDAGDADADATAKNKCLDTCKSYSTPDDIPHDIRTTKLTVDAKHDTLLVPINGTLVPFHIRTIKNISKPNDEGGKYTSIRINFHAPGTSFVQQDMFPESNRSKQTLIYLKELNYRSEDGRNLQAVFRGLKELQKRQRTRELESNTMKDIKEQPSLKLIKDRSRPVLRDLNVKPQLGSTGRNRAVGTLEAHQNGFRFTSSRAEHVDIIYRNIAHAIFQPCENDQTVLLHFNLKDPILVGGKKKTYDIQFYTETRSAGDDLGTRRRAGYDPDEIMDEQREREMITKLNKLFREFVRQVEEQVWSQYAPNLEFDMPYRELGFTGTPNKAHVDIFPCRDCIVALTDWPAYVLSLRNIDIVYFERVSFNLRNFDMTFIFKDYTQTPARISIIPTESLDQIKQWLGELGIVWYQGPTNMNWTNIMKEINKNKQAFIDNGAWEGWFGESVEEGSDDGMDEGDEEYTESEDSDVESEAAGSE